MELPLNANAWKVDIHQILGTQFDLASVGIRATLYPGSLVGQTVVVDRDGLGRDFDSIYGSRGFRAYDVLTVIEDDMGPAKGVPEERLISFRNSGGAECYGTSDRFLVIDPDTLRL